VTEALLDLTEFNFVPWPKIARLNRETIITEKIDGTNAAIQILDDGRVGAQSRKRLITPESDNFGFARWVMEHADELRDGLGPGVHFGEWWGSGIQRGYGLQSGEKRFSLFNTSRWSADNTPNCVSVVPVLKTLDRLDAVAVDDVVQFLRVNGSVAAPGFMNPEGVVAFHVPGRTFYKVLLENDNIPKGADSNTDYSTEVPQ
jgi:hypothetical protein